MNTNDVKFIVAASVVVGVVGVATINYARIVRQERAERREIDKNLQLDLAAIHAAGKELSLRIARGDYDNRLHDRNGLFADMQNEIDFHKIAVREDFNK